MHAPRTAYVIGLRCFFLLMSTLDVDAVGVSCYINAYCCKVLTGQEGSCQKMFINRCSRFIPKAHIMASVEAAITRTGATEEKATKARIGVVGALSRVKTPPHTTR